MERCYRLPAIRQGRKLDRPRGSYARTPQHVSGDNSISDQHNNQLVFTHIVIAYPWTQLAENQPGISTNIVQYRTIHLYCCQNRSTFLTVKSPTPVGLT